MSQLTARQPTPEEWSSIDRSINHAFGAAVAPPSEFAAEVDRMRPWPLRIGVFDGDRAVGGCFAFEMELSLPGGAMVPVSALAGVGISPPDTGRGGLRALMRVHLEQSIEAGATASVLMASESSIYTRFGYGLASEMAEFRADSAEASLMSAPTGSIELLSTAEAAEAISLIAPVYTESLKRRAGGLERTPDWWTVSLGVKERTWIGGGQRFIAIHRNDDGTPDGYALYDIDQRPQLADTTSGHGRAKAAVRCTELTALTIGAECALFEHLRTTPLGRGVIWEHAPADPLVAHRLVDRRQLWQHARLDMMWVRPLDARSLLTSRTYESDGAVAIAYTDPEFPQYSFDATLTVVDGEGVLDESVPGTTTDAVGAVKLEPMTLGQLILGAGSATALHQAGTLDGAPSAVRSLGGLLHTGLAPFNQQKF